jgi:hypothetical protein
MRRPRCRPARENNPALLFIFIKCTHLPRHPRHLRPAANPDFRDPGDAVALDSADPLAVRAVAEWLRSGAVPAGDPVALAETAALAHMWVCPELVDALTAPIAAAVDAAAAECDMQTVWRVLVALPSLGGGSAVGPAAGALAAAALRPLRDIGRGSGGGLAALRKFAPQLSVLRHRIGNPLLCSAAEVALLRGESHPALFDEPDPSPARQGMRRPRCRPARENNPARGNNPAR